MNARALLLVLFTAAPLCAHDGALSLAVVVPTRDTERRVDFHNPSSHFHVLLSNRSSGLEKIWQERFSWGYYALSFEFTDQNGATWTAKRSQTVFTRNVPAYWSIEPGSSLVFDIYARDPEAWQGFRLPANGCQTVSVRAVFEIRADPESERLHVWTGRVASEPRSVTFCEWSSKTVGNGSGASGPHNDQTQ